MTTTENKRILAQNILYYMDLKKVTRNEVCSSLDIKYSTFVEWIKGRAYPRIEALEALANYFDCSKSDLVEDRNKQGNLTDAQKALIQLSNTVPADQAALVLRVLQAVVAGSK